MISQTGRFWPNDRGQGTLQQAVVRPECLYTRKTTTTDFTHRLFFCHATCDCCMHIGLRSSGIGGTCNTELIAHCILRSHWNSRLQGLVTRLHFFCHIPFNSHLDDTTYRISSSPLLILSSVSKHFNTDSSIDQRRGLRADTCSQLMDRFGEGRNKRRQPYLPVDDRPTKLLKPGISSVMEVDGAETPSNGVLEAESEGEDDRVLTLPPVAAADTAEWQATIERVVRNVVSIHFCLTCSFDTDSASSSEATGFVVDAEKGYILTNRHVVCAGPFVGYCIFDNHEEVRHG